MRTKNDADKSVRATIVSYLKSRARVPAPHDLSGYLPDLKAS